MLQARATTLLLFRFVKLPFKHIFPLSILGHVRLTPTKKELEIVFSHPPTDLTLSTFYCGTTHTMEVAENAYFIAVQFSVHLRGGKNNTAQLLLLLLLRGSRGENHPKAEQGRERAV